MEGRLWNEEFQDWYDLDPDHPINQCAESVELDDDSDNDDEAVRLRDNY